MEGAALPAARQVYNEFLPSRVSGRREGGYQPERDPEGGIMPENRDCPGHGAETYLTLENNRFDESWCYQEYVRRCSKCHKPVKEEGE